MAYSCCFLLHFLFIITLIIFLAFSPSNGENLKYAACKDFLFSCGDIKNVGYPFWGDNRPKFCGIPHYKLSCKSDEQKFPQMLLFNGSFISLSVLNINIPSHTMVFSQDNLFDYCNLKYLSKGPLLSTLKPEAGYTNVTLFYGCNNCTSRNHHSNSFSCINSTFEASHSTNGTAYYFGNSRNTSDISSGGKWCSCKNNATFLVDKRGLDELKDSTNANASLRSILTKWPIQFEYKGNFTACSKCEKSGGKCGSPEDESSNEFVCYCRDGSHKLVCPKSDKKLDIALGLGIGGGTFVLVTFIAIWFRKKSGHSKFRTRSASLDSSASDLEKGSEFFGVPLFSYSQLVEATGNFDQLNVLGSGGFGTVYYGKLKDGREVAVKRLYEKNYKRLEQFMNEIQLLTDLRHNNLVLLHGCTSPHSRELLLVYEYVENGTVADHLYGENTKPGFLPWPVRLRIAIETATALSYLHASEIIHRDVKTNNILLDSNFSVKVADFGLSRLFPTDKTHVSTAPQGTPGYLDPEYHQCYQLTNKSDVYSFGVVLIELISSLPAIDMDRHRHEINLSNYAMNRIQRCAFDELVDPQLGFASDFKVTRMTILVAELAFQCLQHDKEFRPSMEEVLEALKKIESADYEALQAEEMVHNAAEEVVKMHVGNTPMPSPTEDDHAKLLSNHQLILSSPISVIDKWISGSTISSSSK